MNPLNIFYTYKTLRLLTTPWTDLPAFKLGVIDKDGNRVLKDHELNREQSDSLGLFERLVFNLKRLLEKVPGGKGKFGAYAAALWLLRESVSMGEDFFEKMNESNLAPEGMITESTTRHYRAGTMVRFEGWVDTDSFNFGTSLREGKVVGKASRRDPSGSVVYFIESDGRNLAASASYMEEVAAGGEGGGSGNTSGNVAGNIAKVDKPLKAGLVKRKMEKA